MAKEQSGGGQRSGAFSALIASFLAQGGEIKKVPENLVSIDWTADTKFRKRAREMSRRGHQKQKLVRAS